MKFSKKAVLIALIFSIIATILLAAASTYLVIYTVSEETGEVKATPPSFIFIAFFFWILIPIFLARAYRRRKEE